MRQYDASHDFATGSVLLDDVEDNVNALISWDGEGLIISTGPNGQEVPEKHIVGTDIAAIYQLRDFLNRVIEALEAER